MNAPTAADPRRPADRPRPVKPSPAAPPRRRGDRLAACWGFVRTVAGWVPLTLLGAVAVPVLVFVYWILGLDRNDMVVQALAEGGLAVVAGAALLVVGVGLWLRFRRQGPAAPLAFEADNPFRTGYCLGRIGWLPLVRIEIAWESPRGVAVRCLTGGRGAVEEATASERGLREEVVRRVRVSDVFGLARVTFRRRLAQQVRVAPHCGKVRALSLFPQHAAGDELAHPEGRAEGDLLEMRRYGPGDPLKHVLWKIYARTGRLLVRTPERAVAPCDRTMAYLIAADGDEPAAGVARAVLENGLFGPDFLFGADGEGESVRTVPEAVEQILRSAEAHGEGAVGLEKFLDHGETLDFRACLLFAPCRPGPWLERVARLMAGRRGPFRVVIGGDGVRPAGRRRWLTQLLFQAAADAAARTADVRSICQRLQRLGADVCVIDRPLGRIIPPKDL